VYEMVRVLTTIYGQTFLRARAISPEERYALLGHRGATAWFTGLPGAGKTTLSIAVERSLLITGCSAYRLDGDEIRRHLSRDLGFDREARAENVRRVANVAAVPGAVPPGAPPWPSRPLGVHAPGQGSALIHPRPPMPTIPEGVKVLSVSEVTQAVAKALGTRHHGYLIELDDVVSALVPTIRAAESPSPPLGPSVVFQHVRQHVKAALCGEGADELYGGYSYMHTPEFADPNALHDRQ